MVNEMFRISLLCVLLIISDSSTASLFSWITGSYTDTTPKLPLEISRPGSRPATVPFNLYPDETGECAPWGNAVLPHYSSIDPTYGSTFPPPGGALIGSYARVPVGSIVAVTNVKSGNTIRVRVVPPQTIPIAGRVMDLSRVAFSQLANLGEGVFVCKVSVIQAPRQTDTNNMHISGSPLVSNNGDMESMRHVYPNLY